MKTNNQKAFLYLVVFSAGVAVLAIELAASRLLAPYFGTSIYVWGNIIGIILIALSLGYWIGGKLADRHSQLDYLMYLMGVGGVTTSLIPILFQWYLKLIVAFRASYLIFSLLGSFLTMIFVFFLPVFLLGMISPFAIRLLISNVESSGKTAGSLYAFSTVGSIFGTFLAAFIFIPFWGTKETIYFSSFILLLLVAWGLKKKPVFFLLILIPIILYFMTKDRNIKSDANLIYETESPYQFIQIVERKNQYQLRVNDGIGVQSIYDSNNILVDGYYDYYTILPFFQKPEKSKDVLIIGLGGGTISHQYLKIFPGHFSLNIDGVELDPEIIKVAKKFFDLAEQNISIHIGDGRNYLEHTEKKYDLIIVDAYSQQIYIPFYLTTTEFFHIIQDHLTPEGILAMNVNATDLKSGLLSNILKTLKAVFPHTYASHCGSKLNYFVLATSQRLDIQRMKESVDISLLKPVADKVASNFQEIKNNQNAAILTDNKAPVELLTENEILNYFISGI